MQFTRLTILTCILSFALPAVNAQSAADSAAKNNASRYEQVQLFRKIFKDSLPGPVGNINDYDNLFTDNQEQFLDSLLIDYEKKTTIEIGIVCLDTVMTARDDFEALTLAIFNEWGIGKKEKNNGILICICKGYRIMRIQNGDGIAAVLSDRETKTIIDTAFTPLFKEGKYFEGTVNGLRTMMKRLK